MKTSKQGEKDGPSTQQPELATTYRPKQESLLEGKKRFRIKTGSPGAVEWFESASEESNSNVERLKEVRKKRFKNSIETCSEGFQSVAIGAVSQSVDIGGVSSNEVRTTTEEGCRRIGEDDTGFVYSENHVSSALTHSEIDGTRRLEASTGVMSEESPVIAVSNYNTQSDHNSPPDWAHLTTEEEDESGFNSIPRAEPVIQNERRETENFSSDANGLAVAVYVNEDEITYDDELHDGENPHSVKDSIDDMDQKQSLFCRGKWRWIVVALLIIIMVVLMLSALAVDLEDNGPKSYPSTMTLMGPTISPTYSPSSAPTTQERFRIVQAVRDVTYSLESTLMFSDTPQSRAIDWLWQEDSYFTEENYTFNQDIVQQRFAVLVLFYATNPDFFHTYSNATSSLSWLFSLNFLNASTSECQWGAVVEDGTLSKTYKGVQCDENGLVTGLTLFGNNLTGSLPPEIQGLPNLVSLDLHRNAITHSIPKTLSKLTSLQELNLNENELVGSIPTAIEAMTALSSLSMNGNGFEGQLPASMGNMSQLIDLYLNNNSLFGILPSTFGKLYQLRTMHLQNNFLMGTIPPEWSDMTSLVNVRLDGNDFDFKSNMELFCDIMHLDLGQYTFGADCREQDVPRTLKELDCPCCTICCNENGCEGGN